MEDVTSATGITLPYGLRNDSTETSVKTAILDWNSIPLYHVVKLISPICLPTLFLLGTFGNLMTIIITRRMASKQSTINIYFTAMGLADVIFLPTITMPWWLRQVSGYDVRAAHTVLCKLHTFVYTSSATTSCWYLVCMTVHRAMSVVWPHRVNLMCTRRTIFLALAGIAVFFVLLYSHYIFGSDTLPKRDGSGYFCMQTEDFQYFVSKIFVYIDLTVYSVLPFFILVVSNGVLMWKLKASVKAASTQLAQGDSEQAQAREKAANSVTLTVIAVSLSFLLLTLPSAIFSILSHSAMINVVVDVNERYKAVLLILTNDVCVLLAISNGAVNFYLYCLTGKKFREEFIKIMTCGRKG